MTARLQMDNDAQDANTLMERVAALEKAIYYLQDRVTGLERALTAAHGAKWLHQQGQRDEPASEF